MIILCIRVFGFFEDLKKIYINFELKLCFYIVYDKL